MKEKEKSQKLALPKPLPRIAHFERLGYGLFLHWGLYSLLGQGEWIQHSKKISPSIYSKLTKKFNAMDFRAKNIARLARESGMKYVVLTTRHHDGFSLYDTRGLSSFDAIHSAAKRDLVAEFVEGCRSEGISPFFYHTTLDWRWSSDVCGEKQFGEYLDFLHASVEILCRNYGKIGGLWFDGNWSRAGADWKEDRLYALIRKYQPEAMIINNTGLGARGIVGHQEVDSVTFEQGLPEAPDRRGWPKYVAGEMCETMNTHWGIGQKDFRFKGPVEVIEHLCACRRVGANYLLNIGPTGGGAIPAYEASVLQKVGEWLIINGHAIYEGRPVAARCHGKDFLLKANGRYYYFAHRLARLGDANVVERDGENRFRTVEGPQVKFQSMRWLDDRKQGIFFQSPSGDLTTIDCADYDYGSELVVRVAEFR